MDINYLLTREQVERALARASVGPGARAAHVAMADRYRTMLDTRRRSAHAHIDATTILATGPRPVA